MRPSLKPITALLLMALLLLAGYVGDPAPREAASPRSADPRSEAAPSGVVTPDTVAVFVVMGNGNMRNQGRPGNGPEPSLLVMGSRPAYEWLARPIGGNDSPVFDLFDPIPGVTVAEQNGPSEDGTKGSIWHPLVINYHDATGHTVFMSSAAYGGTTTRWQAPDGINYTRAREVIDRAMIKAEAYFNPDPMNPAYEVVFGGLIWTLSPGLAGSTNNHYPWDVYRAELDTLLHYIGQDVIAPRGGRFYHLSSVIPARYQYPDYDSTDHRKSTEIFFAQDLEADVCAAYAFCTRVQAADTIKRAQQECRDDPTYGTACEGWYANDETEDPHWGQAGLNLIGDTLGTLAAEHRPYGSGTPDSWELAVEVPAPIEWCATPPAPCPSEVPDLRLDVYDDTGALVDTFYVRPSLDHLDWRADFDDSDPDADWKPTWATLSTAFLTLELVREGGGAPTETLARYAFTPGEGPAGFFRPTTGGARAAAHLEVFADNTVKARMGASRAPYFEDAFAGGDDSYVLPYNHDHFEGVCDGDALASLAGCLDAPPDFFLARLPLSDPLPDDTERRFVFADEADVVVPTVWGPLAWEVDGLVLTFPQGRRLLVETDLAVSGAVLTEAAAGQGWGGVAVYEPGSLDLNAVTVTKAEVGIEVNAAGNVFDDVLLDGNGVGILTGYACSRTASECTARSDFRLSASCVTNSVFVDEVLEGYGIWARHTDAFVWGSTVSGNGAYGLFLDDADVTPYLLLLEDNGTDDTGAPDGAHVLAGGDLSLVILYSDPPSGENLIESNAGTQLFVGFGGYATVGLASGTAPRNHLARGGATGVIIDNDSGNPTLPAVATYWGTGGTPPGAPPSGSILGPVNTAFPLTASPSGAAGHPDDCASAGAAGGTSLLRGSGLLRGGGAPDPAPRVIDPEAAAWFAARVDSLRAALTEDDDDGLVRALYATQRLDRDDDLGEREATMGLLAGIRGRLTGGGPLTASERRAAEAALVAAVHDALRAVRLDEARSLVAPFVSGSSPLPEIEGDGARHALALALAALDEADGEVASAIARIEAVVAELGGGAGAGFGGGEDPPLVRDLEATAALLARRLGGAGAGGREGGPPVALASSASGLPAAYALGLPYPNPTTGLTAVPFALPEEARVEVSVYDLLGRRVAVLAEGAYGAGRHVAALDGRGLASGVYVVRAVMAAEGSAGFSTRSFTRRVTLIR